MTNKLTADEIRRHLTGAPEPEPTEEERLTEELLDAVLMAVNIMPDVAADDGFSLRIRRDAFEALCRKLENRGIFDVLTSSSDTDSVAIPRSVFRQMLEDEGFNPDDYESTQDAFEALRSKWSELKEAPASAGTDESSAEVSILVEQVQQLKERLSAAASDRDACRERVDTLTTRLNNANSRASELEDQLNAASTTDDTVEEALNAIIAKLELDPASTPDQVAQHVCGFVDDFRSDKRMIETLQRELTAQRQAYELLIPLLEAVGLDPDSSREQVELVTALVTVRPALTAGQQPANDVGYVELLEYYDRLVSDYNRLGELVRKMLTGSHDFGVGNRLVKAFQKHIIQSGEPEAGEMQYPNLTDDEARELHGLLFEADDEEDAADAAEPDPDVENGSDDPVLPHRRPRPTGPGPAGRQPDS